MDSTSDARARRLASEAAYFDRQAAAREVAAISSAVVRRYRESSWLTRRFSFGAAMASAEPILPSTRVLDVGCGEGGDAVLFATLGAREAVGIDISPASVEHGRQMAVASGVSDRTRFLVGDVADLSAQQFDLVWCHAILHHVLDDLPRLLGAIHGAVRPGGRLVIIEPVALSPLLRRARLAIGTPGGTEDERPLAQAELALLHEAFPGMRVRYYRALGRLTNRVLGGRPLETSPRVRRAIVAAIQVTDRVFTRLPFGSRLASVIVAEWTRPIGPVGSASLTPVRVGRRDTVSAGRQSI